DDLFDFFADIWFGYCQEADFIPHIFSNVPQRELVIDFNFLVPQHERLSILSYTKPVYNGSPFKIFNSFSPHIWILIAVSFVLYGTLNWLNMRREHRPNGNRLLTNFSEMFALLLGQGRVLHPIVCLGSISPNVAIQPHRQCSPVEQSPTSKPTDNMDLLYRPVATTVLQGPH